MKIYVYFMMKFISQKKKHSENSVASNLEVLKFFVLKLILQKKKKMHNQSTNAANISRIRIKSK